MRKLSALLIVAMLAALLSSVGVAQEPRISVSSGPAPAGVVLSEPSPEDVLWDQPLSTTDWVYAYVDQEFLDSPDYSSFLADDFVNAAPWYISSIFVPGEGWNLFTTLFNAASLTWEIYADNAGEPMGDPWSGGAFWSLTLAPTDSQVTITPGTSALPSNVSLNLATPVTLPPGHWWFVFYPTMAFAWGQYGRQPADTTNGYWGYFINPGGAFGLGQDWQPWTVLGTTKQDMAFRLEGTSDELMFARVYVDAREYPDGYEAAGIVRVKDEAGAPVEGAEVTMFLKDPAANTWTESGFTNPNGRVKFKMTDPVGGPWLFCMEDIVLAGYYWAVGPRCGFIWYPGDPPLPTQ